MKRVLPSRIYLTKCTESTIYVVILYSEI